MVNKVTVKKHSPSKKNSMISLVPLVSPSEDIQKGLSKHTVIFAIHAMIYIVFALLIGSIVIMTLPVMQKLFASIFTSENIYLIWTPQSSVVIAGLAGFCIGLLLLAGIQKILMRSIPIFREYIISVKTEYYQLLQRSSKKNTKESKSRIDSIRTFEKSSYFMPIFCFIILLVFILYFTALANYAAVQESGFIYRPYLSITGEFHAWNEFDYALVKPRVFTDSNGVSSLYVLYFLVNVDKGISVNIADNADVTDLIQINKLLQQNKVFIKRSPLTKKGILLIQNLPLEERQKINELLMIKE